MRAVDRSPKQVWLDGETARLRPNHCFLWRGQSPTAPSGAMFAHDRRSVSETGGAACQVHAAVRAVEGIRLFRAAGVRQVRACGGIPGPLQQAT